MDVRTITKPEVEPIPLAEAKINLRVDHNDEDGEIGRMITAAREELEKVQGRAYITRTLAGTLDAFPSSHSGLILLPFPPASEIVSITYWDPEINLVTMDPSDYEFDQFSAPARLRPSTGNSWPATLGRFAAVEIHWKAGFGDDPTDVPPEIRQAIKLLLTDFYENRESIVLGLNVNSTKQIEQLIADGRITSGNLIP